MITVILKPGLTRPNSTRSEDPSKVFGHQMNYRLNTIPHSWNPPTDIYEVEEKIIVLVELAGMREEDFSIGVDRNNISISGVRNSPLSERKAIHQLEILFGNFSTQIEFSIELDTEKTEATYQNGFLLINLVKAETKTFQVTKD